MIVKGTKQLGSFARGINLYVPKKVIGGGGEFIDPSSIVGLKLWLKADAGVTYDGSNNISLWEDQSENGNDATGDIGGGTAPIYMTNQLNTKPAISFNSQFLTIPNILSTATAASAFVVVKPDNVEGDSGPLLGNIQSDGIYGGHYPYQGGLIYDSFATTVRKDEISKPGGFFNWHIYNVASIDGDWRYIFNGNVHYSTSSNTFSNNVLNSEGPFIGRNTADGDYRFIGKIAEIIVYNKVLTTQERQQVEGYLDAKYAVIPADGIALKFDGNVIDSYGDNVQFSLNGGATITSSIKKYGSGALDTNFSRCVSTAYKLKDLNSSNWTAECWIYRPTDYTSNRQGIINLAADGTWFGVNIYYYPSDGGLVANDGAAGDIAANVTIPIETWTHIAVVMNAGSKRIYVDGIDQEVIGSQQAYAGPYRVNIGQIDAAWGGDPFASDIIIDEVRISDFARYTSNFTPSNW